MKDGISVEGGNTIFGKPFRKAVLLGGFGAVLAVLGMFPATASGAEAQSYVCLKCRMRLSQASRPNASYCRAGGNHNWYLLGKTGPLIHVCLKCRMLVHTAARPNAGYCRAGGNHNWYLLGKKGRDNYRCRKCHLQLRTAGRPNASHCEAGGNHNWFKY